MCDMNGLRIIPSYRCNYDCEFCYQKDHSIDHSQILTLEALANKITILRNSGFRPIYITFMGGEFSLLKNSIKYINLINDYFPYSKKSITTNGSADLEYYSLLKSRGIDNITFSVNELTRKLKSSLGFLYGSVHINVRINTFFNQTDPKKMQEILEYCIDKRIDLTFCIDIRSKDIPGHDQIHKVLDLKDGWIVKVYPNHYIFTDVIYEYSFWVFHHKGNYKNDNYIILPSGELTSNFNRVIDCHGA